LFGWFWVIDDTHVGTISATASTRRCPRRHFYFQCDVIARLAVNLAQLFQQQIAVARVDHTDQLHFFDTTIIVYS
jgi:hypothetical protein